MAADNKDSQSDDSPSCSKLVLVIDFSGASSDRLVIHQDEKTALQYRVIAPRKAPFELFSIPFSKSVSIHVLCVFRWQSVWGRGSHILNDEAPVVRRVISWLLNQQVPFKLVMLDYKRSEDLFAEMIRRPDEDQALWEAITSARLITDTQSELNLTSLQSCLAESTFICPPCQEWRIFASIAKTTIFTDRSPRDVCLTLIGTTSYEEILPGLICVKICFKPKDEINWKHAALFVYDETCSDLAEVWAPPLEGDLIDDHLREIFAYLKTYRSTWFSVPDASTAPSPSWAVPEPPEINRCWLM